MQGGAPMKLQLELGLQLKQQFCSIMQPDIMQYDMQYCSIICSVVVLLCSIVVVLFVVFICSIVVLCSIVMQYCSIVVLCSMICSIAVLYAGL